MGPARARVVGGHDGEPGALELGLREREGRGGPQHLEHQGAPAEVRQVADGRVLLREEDAAVLALAAADHDERGVEPARALLQDEGREDGLDDELHLAPGEPLRQVVEVPRDHQFADVHPGGSEALAETRQHLAEDPEHAVGLVRLLGDDAETERARGPPGRRRQARRGARGRPPRAQRPRATADGT